MSDVGRYLSLIEDRDHDGIESARDHMKPEHVKPLVDYYFNLEEGDWESKACVVYLTQDQPRAASGLASAMLDFLRAPPGPDDTIDLAQAIALGFQGEEYYRFMDYYNDRDLLRHDVAVVLKANGLRPWPNS